MLWLQVIYWGIVVLSLISISKPYHLSAQIIFYILNGVFIALYIYIEATKSPHITIQAVHYYRLIATTVGVALIFSVMSGYSRFSAAYSYDVKSHLFLFVSNSLVFMVKLPYIVHPDIYLRDTLKATQDKKEADKTASFIKASSSTTKTIAILMRPGDEIAGFFRIFSIMLLAAFFVVLVAYFSVN
jgi:hypothetical protein